jgi:hypothetical protein
MSRKPRIEGAIYHVMHPVDQRGHIFRYGAFRTRRIPMTQSGSFAAIVIVGTILGGRGSRHIVLLRKRPVSCV